MFIPMLSYAKTFLVARHKGQGLIEYAILVIVVVAIALVAASLFGDSIVTLFQKLENAISGANPTYTT